MYSPTSQLHGLKGGIFVETFLNGLLAASLEALQRGQASLGVEISNQVLTFDELIDSNSLFLTGNTDSVYVSAFLNLKKEGPTVIEVRGL